MQIISIYNRVDNIDGITASQGPQKIEQWIVPTREIVFDFYMIVIDSFWKKKFSFTQTSSIPFLREIP